MLNSTFLNLILTNTNSRSPLFSLSPLKSKLSFSVKNSKFSKTFNNVIYTNFFPNIKIQVSTFRRTLNSAIQVDSSDLKIYSEKRNQQVTEEMGLVDIDRSFFEACSGDSGGALKTSVCAVAISSTVFEQNNANIAGACSIMRTQQFSMRLSQFNTNSANYIGAMIVDCDLEETKTTLITSNFSKNSAEMWGACLRLDRCGGNVTKCFFDNNTALVSGAFFDFSCSPSVRYLYYNAFLDNNCTSRGTATCFHLLQISFYSECVFAGNKCEKGPKAISVESINSEITITNCYFDGPEKEQIGQRFNYSEFFIYNCSWNQNDHIIHKKLISIGAI